MYRSANKNNVKCIKGNHETIFFKTLESKKLRNFPKYMEIVFLKTLNY